MGGIEISGRERGRGGRERERKEVRKDRIDKISHKVVYFFQIELTLMALLESMSTSSLVSSCISSGIEVSWLVPRFSSVRVTQLPKSTSVGCVK